MKNLLYILVFLMVGCSSNSLVKECEGNLEGSIVSINIGERRDLQWLYSRAKQSVGGKRIYNEVIEVDMASKKYLSTPDDANFITLYDSVSKAYQYRFDSQGYTPRNFTQWYNLDSISNVKNNISLLRADLVLNFHWIKEEIKRGYTVCGFRIIGYSSAAFIFHDNELTGYCIDIPKCDSMSFSINTSNNFTATACNDTDVVEEFDFEPNTYWNKIFRIKLDNPDITEVKAVYNTHTKDSIQSIIHELDSSFFNTSEKYWKETHPKK